MTFSFVFVFEKLALFSRKFGSLTFKFSGVIVLTVIFVLYQFSPVYIKIINNVYYGFDLPNNNLNVQSFFSKADFDFMKNSSSLIDKKYRVAGDPHSGTTASWFLYGQRNIFYHWAFPRDEQRQIILYRLNQANSDPSVCNAVDELKLRYVYSFAGKCFNGDDCGNYVGLNNLEENGVAKLINQDKIGNKLFEITACD